VVRRRRWARDAGAAPVPPAHDSSCRFWRPCSPRPFPPPWTAVAPTYLLSVLLAASAPQLVVSARRRGDGQPRREAQRIQWPRAVAFHVRPRAALSLDAASIMP
jgi:hypothetical protein